MFKKFFNTIFSFSGYPYSVDFDDMSEDDDIPSPEIDDVVEPEEKLVDAVLTIRLKESVQIDGFHKSSLTQNLVDVPISDVFQKAAYYSKNYYWHDANMSKNNLVLIAGHNINSIDVTFTIGE